MYPDYLSGVFVPMITRLEYQDPPPSYLDHTSKAIIYTTICTMTHWLAQPGRVHSMVFVKKVVLLHAHPGGHPFFQDQDTYRDGKENQVHVVRTATHADRESPTAKFTNAVIAPASNPITVKTPILFYLNTSPLSFL